MENTAKKEKHKAGKSAKRKKRPLTDRQKMAKRKRIAKRKMISAFHSHGDCTSRPSSPNSKVAVHKAFQSLVAITSYDVPDDMVNAWMYAIPRKYVFCGHGMIVESEVANDDTYLITILAPAMLFKRTNGIDPPEVKLDVRAPDGKLYKGEVLCCDFHYNLAAVRIKSESPFEPASLRALNDVSSIDNDEHELPQSDGNNTFQIRRHSDLFKVQAGTKIIAVNNSYNFPFSFDASCGVFRTTYHFHYACKELYWVKCAGGVKSGAVINPSGEVLGILFDESAFLPSNFILRWWSHYKSKGKFCRPWVGVEVGNFSEARSSIPEQFKTKISEKGIGTCVIVTKVEKDTPAYRSGIRINDAIIKCDGKQVRSKMEFFESMWDNAGNRVELRVLRSSDGQELNLSMSIEEATSTNFYEWMRPSVVALAIDDDE